MYEVHAWKKSGLLFRCLRKIFIILILDVIHTPKKANNNSNTKPADNNEFKKIQKNNFQLQEENNMLKVKNELLLDMISEIYSEMKLESEK